jgi:hypothetical protein
MQNATLDTHDTYTQSVAGDDLIMNHCRWVIACIFVVKFNFDNELRGRCAYLSKIRSVSISF